MSEVKRYKLFQDVRYDDGAFVIPAGQVVIREADYDVLRDERDRLRRALEQVSFHLAQPGDDETPANQYVPTAAEIVTCQRIIDAALTPAGEGRNDG